MMHAIFQMVKPTQDFQEVGHGEVDDSMAKHTLGDFGGLQRLSIMKNCRRTCLITCSNFGLVAFQAIEIAGLLAPNAVQRA